MGRISIDMIRKRAEHNEGMISNLEELALHQQHIEKIEVLHKVCRHLKILLLQSNLIHKLQNLHRLKELQYLNVALNNISKIQNLQRCESLNKVDLTMNFVPKKGLLSVSSLRENVHLRDLYLMGNPCSDWSGYRQYVIASVAQLDKLDGKDIKPSERIAAQQALHGLQGRLIDELKREEVDIEAAEAVEDDGLEYSSDTEIEDPGFVDPHDGEFKRPWCPETRILEHRENERIEREQEQQKIMGQNSTSSIFGPKPSVPRWDNFPDINEGEKAYQKNEGEWDFTLDESDDGTAIVLETQLGKYVDTTLVKADVQPCWARLLIKGRLLQLKLPCEVQPDKSAAQRSKASGKLVLKMPKRDAASPHLDPACLRIRPGFKENQRTSMHRQACTEGLGHCISEHAKFAYAQDSTDFTKITSKKTAISGDHMRATRKAAFVQCDDDNSDEVPSL